MRVQGSSLALAALVAVWLTAPGMLRAQSGTSAPVDSAAKKPDPPPPPVNHLETALAGFKLSGYAAGSYSYSGRSVDTAIVGRLYDRLQNRFMLNGLVVVLDKPSDPAKLSAGFHSELLLGQDASLPRLNPLDLIHVASWPSSSSEWNPALNFAGSDGLSSTTTSPLSMKRFCSRSYSRPTMAVSTLRPE